MQAETAVKWLKQVAEEIRAEGHAGWGNTLDDVCAMLDGKVLCDVEPVAWMCPNDWIAYTTRQEGDRPLYAAVDIGKEGGDD
jgi:hypothetical protein